MEFDTLTNDTSVESKSECDAFSLAYFLARAKNLELKERLRLKCPFLKDSQ